MANGWELTLAERFLVDRAWANSGYAGRDELLEAVAKAGAMKMVGYYEDECTEHGLPRKYRYQCDECRQGLRYQAGLG